MTKRRKRTRTPRLALVDFSQLKRLEAVLDQAEEVSLRLGRLMDDLLTLKAKRSAAASKANETRRQRHDAPAELPPNTGTLEDANGVRY